MLVNRFYFQYMNVTELLNCIEIYNMFILAKTDSSVLWERVQCLTYMLFIEREPLIFLTVFPNLRLI